MADNEANSLIRCNAKATCSSSMAPSMQSNQRENLDPLGKVPELNTTLLLVFSPGAR